MNPHRALLLVVAYLLLTSADCIVAREWISSDGKFRLQADLFRFNGMIAELKKGDGNIAKVPVYRLSADDRQFLWTQVNNPHFAAVISPSLKTFKTATEEMRPIEIRRIETRIENLRKELRAGARDIKHPIGQQAKALMRHLVDRLKVLKSGAAFVPALSPKDFRVGQIGTLDDDLQFSIGSEPDGDEIKIGITFHEVRSTNDLADIPGYRSSWHHLTVSRPDLMYLKSNFVDRLPKTHLDRKLNSPANRMLRSHVYQVVEVRPRGAAKDYVITPFAIDTIEPLLTGKPPAKEVSVEANEQSGVDSDSRLPDLIITDVKVHAFKGNRFPYTYTIKNVGQSPHRKNVTWQAYYSKDRVFDKQADRPAHGTTVFFGSGLGPGQSIDKNWGFHPSDRDPEKRYLVFLIDPKNKVEELSEDNNTFAVDTWKYRSPNPSGLEDL